MLVASSERLPGTAGSRSFKKANAQGGLMCFRGHFKLDPFEMRGSSGKMMCYERCQDLFSSDSTPFKTICHWP